MRKKLFVLSLFISFLLIGISNSRANLYVVEWYGQNGTTSYVPAFYSPNISSNDVHFDLGAYGNLTGGSSYSTATGLYSPYSSLIATMENDFSGNYGCIYLGGTVNKANSGNTIEAKTITTSTGTATNITTRTKYVYEGSTRNLVFVLNDSVFDNENKIKNLYFAETNRTMNMDIWQSNVNIASIKDFYKFIDDYNNCEGGKSINSTFLTANSFSPKNINYNIHVSTSLSTTRIIDIRSYFFVFNSSANGIVNISLFLNQTFIDDGGDDCSLASFFKIQYAKMENSPAIISLGETNNINSNLLLTTNKIYILEMTFASEIAPTGGGTCSRNISDIINGFVSIDTYIPTWICGNYGECFNGTRSRECNDTNGLTAPKIENDVCYTLPEKTLNLGFENKQSFDVFYAQPTWWIVACPFAISSKSVDYPSDWIINNITNPKINNTGSPEIIAFVRDTLKMDNQVCYGWFIFVEDVVYSTRSIFAFVS